MRDLDNKALIGKKIKSFTTSTGDIHAVLDMLDGRKFQYTVDGDCCSSTWIEHITIPPDIEGATLLEVRDSDPIEAFEEDHEYLQVYHTTFVTDKGEIILEYRNSSNGYYGGSISGPVEIK